MKENEFRGMSVKNEMIYGSLVVTNRFLKHKPAQHTKTWIVKSAFGNGGWFNIIQRQYVKPDTVGQYTGLKDKERKIFEDDLYKHPDGTHFIVKQIDGAYRAFYPHDGFDANIMLQIGKKGMAKYIGNIHENKDLLK